MQTKNGIVQKAQSAPTEMALNAESIRGSKKRRVLGNEVSKEKKLDPATAEATLIFDEGSGDLKSE
jgi:hypothetical protein